MKRKTITMRALLAHVATILEAPRDRLGRLDFASGDLYAQAASKSREAIRELAVNNCCTGSRDTAEMVAKVIRVHLGE